jgi:methylglyoxal synthase
VGVPGSSPGWSTKYYTLENKLKIAVIAHDGKKADMVAFIMKRLDFFRKVNVVATGTTGKHIEHAGLDVDCLKSGPLGGDAQIASMIADGEISAVIFFVDPLDVHPHQVDVSMLLRICNVYNVPLATNYMTASYIIRGLKNELDTDK